MLLCHLLQACHGRVQFAYSLADALADFVGHVLVRAVHDGLEGLVELVELLASCGSVFFRVDCLFLCLFNGNVELGPRC